MNVDMLSRMPFLRKSKTTGEWYLREAGSQTIVPGTVGTKSHAAECWVAYGMLAGEYAIIDLRGLPEWTMQISESYGHNSCNGKCDTRNDAYAGKSDCNMPVVIRLSHPKADTVDLGPVWVRIV